MDKETIILEIIIIFGLSIFLFFNFAKLNNYQTSPIINNSSPFIREQEYAQSVIANVTQLIKMDQVIFFPAAALLIIAFALILFSLFNLIMSKIYNINLFEKIKEFFWTIKMLIEIIFKFFTFMGGL